MKKLILLHTLLFSAIAHAILDANNNGLSDLWEKQYNDGQLFSPTNPEHLPNADPDLDGWDNRTEAAAGTDPSLANPPEGIVANTLLPSATAGAYTLTWPTRIGKRYQLQASTDLENWLPVGEPIIAENTSHSIGINVTEPGSPTPPKLFWHITIDDIDSDSDGLTNNEEHQLGTNPNSPDSDGDGLPDSWELNHNLNPNDSADAADPFPDSSLSNLQAYAAGVQANPNATIADKDGDGVDNSDDAAPDDGTIDWKRTANPHFAVIELPVTDVESLRLDDFSENGTVLFTRVQASAPVHRVLVDRQFAAHVVPFQAQSGGFGGNGPTLIGDRMLGFRIPEQTTVECTWDPLDDSYVAFPLLMYHDDICDVRGNFRVDRKSPGLNTPQGILAGSTWCNARIEQNGNIVSSDGGYWRFNHDTSTYGPINTLAEHTIARSATLTQTKPATQGSGQVTRNWNLVAGLTGLHISDEAAPFVKSQLAFNSSRIPLGVTQQGWVATASEIWSNGTWQPVKDLLGGTTPQQATLLGILDTGLAVAKIQKANQPMKIGQSEFLPVLLVPVELIQGELGTDSESTGNWLMSEADPKPEVEMDVISAAVSGHDLVVTVRGTAVDKLSKYGETAAEKVQSLRFIVGGEVLHSIPVAEGIGAGIIFNETITIPNAKPGGYTLRAETSENCAGNKGWDKVAVGLNFAKFPNNLLPSGTEYTIAFTQNPSSASVDSAKVYFENRAPVVGDLTLTETAVDSSQFEGQVHVVIGGQTESVPCTVLFKGTLSLESESADSRYAEISYTLPTHGENRLYGKWSETANNSLIFRSSGYLGGDETLTVGAMVNLPGSEQEDIEPITLRIYGSDDWVDSETIHIQVGGVNYPLKKFTFAGKEALYPYEASNPDHPKQFLPSAKNVPQKLHTPGYTAGGGRYEFQIMSNASIIGKQTAQVQRAFRKELYSFYPAPTVSAARPAGAAVAGWTEPGDKITRKDLLDAYEWIYGTNEDAMTLLNAFLENGNIITLKGVWGELDVNYFFRTDNKIEIEIEDEDDDVNPVVCANLLHAGLYRALAYPPLNTHPDVTANIDLFVASRVAFAQKAAEITATTAELYLSGATIVSEPLDWLIIVNDVSEGHYESLAGMLPFVPAGAVKAGAKPLRIATKAGRLLGEITDPLHIEAIARASRKRAFTDKIAILEEAGISDEMIAILGRGDELLASKSRANLKKRMLKKGEVPPGFEAHHDLPWEFRQRFAEAKLDVNDPQFGRWAHPDDHSHWHYEDPKFNDVWEDFFYGEPVNGMRPEITHTKAEVLQKLEEIKAQYPKTRDK